MSGSALISTVYSPVGGLTTMVLAVAGFLEEEGWEVRLAYYMPWSEAPELSVRFPNLAGSPDWRLEQWEGGDLEAYEIGVQYPEFEWRRYRLAGGWREAIEAHDVHLVVSGNLLPARPALEAGVPCLAWIAARYWLDKRDRIRCYPWLRRVFDLAVNTPVALAWERRLARRVRLVALSEHTAREFAEAVSCCDPPVIPMGVDTTFFRPEGPARSPRKRPRIGFVGRLGDPRKNVGLLSDTLICLADWGVDAELDLVGGDPGDEFRERIREAGLEDRVRVTARLAQEDLPAYYRGLDVFVLPSYQEGLGIVSLEAMACGCPVVSTRCGGPEEYMEHGENGFLVDFDAEAMADAVARLLTDSELRGAMGCRAEETVHDRFSLDRIKEMFWTEFDKAFK